MREARKELVERELRMETLLRVTDSYILISEEGIIQEVNDALLDLVGYDWIESPSLFHCLCHRTTMMRRC